MNDLPQTSFINIFKALADFQQECPIIHKGTQGYGYTYADLPKILEVITPLLGKHNLGFTQLLKDNGLETIIFHTKSGEYISSHTSIPTATLKGMNEYQSFGSGITYYRRYALSAALGLVTDKDVDAADIKPSFIKKHKTMTDLTLAIDMCESVSELTKLHDLNKDLINPGITALFTAKKSSL